MFKQRLSALRLAAIGPLALCLMAPAAWGQLYFSQDSNGNGLYEINTDTGAATLVGSGITGVTTQTVGLAPSADPAVLFGTSFNDLLEIQADGAGSTNIGGDGQEGLAYCAGTDTLYGAINGDFATVDQATGIETLLTSPGSDVEGIACDDASGVVYGVSSSTDDLLAYDIAGDSWSTVGSTGVNFDDMGLAFDGTVLFAINALDDSVYSIDPATGAATLIGPTGLSESGGGLAWGGPVVVAPPAEPVAVPLMPLWLLALMGGALAWLGLRSSVKPS